MTKRKLFLILGLSVLAALALTGVASAQEGPDDEVTDDEVNAIAGDLYCPICENTPLDVCPTQACEDWRDEIRSILGAGGNEADVQEYFVERYGVRVLGEPPRSGFTGLVWILPFVGLAGGVLFLANSMFQMRRAASGPSAAKERSAPARTAPAADGLSEAERQHAAYVARLERELKEFAL